MMDCASACFLLLTDLHARTHSRKHAPTRPAIWPRGRCSSDAHHAIATRSLSTLPQAPRAQAAVFAPARNHNMSDIHSRLYVCVCVCVCVCVVIQKKKKKKRQSFRPFAPFVGVILYVKCQSAKSCAFF